MTGKGRKRFKCVRDEGKGSQRVVGAHSPLEGSQRQQATVAPKTGQNGQGLAFLAIRMVVVGSTSA